MSRAEWDASALLLVLNDEPGAQELAEELGDAVIRLSMGDRACLGLTVTTGLPVVTVDRAWQGLRLGIEVRVARA